MLRTQSKTRIITLWACFSAGLITAFNTTICPHYWEIQTNRVKESFDINKMEGTYYELAFQDITQYPACPGIMGGPQCVQSIKNFQPYKRPPLLNDTWTLQCGPTVTEVPLLFNLTGKPGYFWGWTTQRIGQDQIWPDTVVDYKLTEDGKYYEWVIELQCQDQDDIRPTPDQQEIKFTAVNFYARHYNVTEAYYNEFIQAGYDAGIGVFMDYKYGLYKCPMDDCEWFEDQQDVYPSF